jgi:hypothetical protein
VGFLILKKGPAESTEGDTTTMSPQSSRRMEHFQSHFARDLAQTLPAMTNGSSSVITTTNGYYHHHQNGNSNGVGVVAYPRVRFAVPEHEQSHFPPGTISSSSLVWKKEVFFKRENQSFSDVKIQSSTTEIAPVFFCFCLIFNCIFIGWRI